MSQETRYEFDSLDLEQAVNSPELPEMFETLLTLYRSANQSKERLEETVQSLLNRIYGPKSEKSKYHETQKVLAPEFLEDAEAFDDGQPDEPIDTSDVASDDSEEKPAKTKDKKKRKGAHGRSKIPAHVERRVVETELVLQKTLLPPDYWGISIFPVHRTGHKWIACRAVAVARRG